MAKAKTKTKTKNPVILFIICLFLGWFGIDKLYFGGKVAWKYALIKFLTMFIIIGFIWNIYDMVCVVMEKYRLNPLK